MTNGANYKRDMLHHSPWHCNIRTPNQLNKNSTPSSSLNNSRVADITQHVTSTPSATQRRSIITLTTTPGTSSRNTPAPSRTIQTDSTCRVVSSQHPALLALPLLSAVLKPAYPHPESRSPRNHYKSTANASYRKELETEAVVFATAGGVYTSINGLRQLLHPLIWSLRHDASCICNGQTPGALHVEQMAIYECKRLGDGKLCNATRCESIS